MTDEFQRIQDLHSHHKLQEAKAECDLWLTREPNSEIALNSCGLIYAKLGQMHPAIAFFQRAISINPSVVAYHNNLSNAYLALGQIEKAKQHLTQALRINPHHAESYNNFGTILYKQSLFLEAIPYFEKAIRIHPDYWEAHYNIAHSFTKTNQVERAITHYYEVLRLVTDHPSAHFNLGLLLFEKGNEEDASHHLQKALEISPQNAIAAQYLGNVWVSLGKVQDAIETYERALIINPNLSDVHHNLAVLYLRNDEKTKALAHFENALNLDPSNDTARHMRAALQGEQSPDAPKTYVTDLFDQYAEYYNHHVKEKLQYDVPHLLRSAIGRHLSGKLRAGRVLDLGCGTGLCGIYLRDLALELIGLDLSAKMIEKAQALNAYDSLIKTDFNEYLRQPNLEPFDLIVAGDVLVYMGNLDALFASVHQSLRKDGRFAFTTEHLENGAADYFLQTSGRFAHASAYIHRLAKQHHFSVAVQEQINPRRDENTLILGELYVLKNDEQ